MPVSVIVNLANVDQRSQQILDALSTSDKVELLAGVLSLSEADPDITRELIKLGSLGISGTTPIYRIRTQNSPPKLVLASPQISILLVSMALWMSIVPINIRLIKRVRIEHQCR
jgi:hypothetical protein